MDINNTPIVPVTDFVRNFREYIDLLPKVTEIVLTRDSYAVATVKSTPKEKNAGLKKFWGIWKGTTLDNDRLWADVLKRRNKKSKYLW